MRNWYQSIQSMDLTLRAETENATRRDRENVPHIPMVLATDVYLSVNHRFIVLFWNVYFLLGVRKSNITIY